MSASGTRGTRWPLAIAVTLLASVARADDPKVKPPQVEATPTPLDRLGPHLVDAFIGTNLLFYGGAVAATATMAFSFTDQGIRVAVQRHLVAPAFADSAYYGGYILPVFVGGGVYALGLLTNDRDLTGAGSAAIQALGVTFATTSLLKFATGRPYPTNGGDPRDPDRLTHSEYAREFRPFQFKGNYAWPSGHMSSSISIAAALTGYYYPEHVWIPLVGYPVALLIGVGMVDGDRHWASDVVAGALIGHAIGYSIGRNFRRTVREPEGAASLLSSLTLRPLSGATYGLAASLAF